MWHRPPTSPRQPFRLKWHEVKSLIATITTLQGRLAEANDFNNDVVEREAACCPEDVPFDEWIAVLRKALLPLASVRVEGSDPNEAVFVRGGSWILNSDIERAFNLLRDND